MHQRRNNTVVVAICSTSHQSQTTKNKIKKPRRKELNYEKRHYSCNFVLVDEFVDIRRLVYAFLHVYKTFLYTYNRLKKQVYVPSVKRRILPGRQGNKAMCTRGRIPRFIHFECGVRNPLQLPFNFPPPNLTLPR